MENCVENIGKGIVSEKILKSIKEGLKVLFVENKGKHNEEKQIAIVVNIKAKAQGFDIDYTFNLMDPSTGEIYLKSNGERRVWMLKKALESSTIKLIDENLKTCPSCGKKALEEGQNICYDCRHKVKKDFFDKKVVLDEKPFFLDDEQVDSLLGDTNTIVTARAGSGKTRVLTAKLIDLFFNQDVREDEVIAFCFNKKT